MLAREIDYGCVAWLATGRRPEKDVDKISGLHLAGARVYLERLAREIDYGCVAQLVRAPSLYLGGPWFESMHTHH